MNLPRPAHELVAKGISPWLARAVPFTGGLTSLPFIAKIALLARMGTAAARIILNFPAFNKSDQYTPQQKRTSFYERIFIEGGGTLVYHGGMYLAMDLAARVWERTRLKSHFLQSLQELTDTRKFHELSQPVQKKLAGQLEDLYRRFYQTRVNSANPVDGLLHLNLFGGDLYGATGPRSHFRFLDTVRDALKKDAVLAPHLKNIERHADQATLPLSRSLVIKGGTLVQIIGVAVSCILGGVVIQRLNDHLIRPLALKLSGDDSLAPGGRPPNVILPASSQPITPTPFMYPQIEASAFASPMVAPRFASPAAAAPPTTYPTPLTPMGGRL